jgi:hypothetical protein
MQQLLHFLVEWIQKLTALTMLCTALGGIGIGSLLLLAARGHYLSNRLFSAVLILMGLTLLNNFNMFWGIYDRFPSFRFLPIYYSLWIGPLIFFLAKSKLYPQFRLQSSDLKHFILPILQASLFTWVSMQDNATKEHIFKTNFSPAYGGLEDACFILLTWLYLYFGYRFVKHAMAGARHTGADRREILIIGWLKRMIKVFFIWFGIHASFLATDWFSFWYLATNLRTKTLFSSGLELSFAAMLGWLTLNALFGWRRRI